MKKDLLQEVKKLVFGEEELQFLDVKTTEGVILRVQELAEGQTVSIVSEDGENVSGAGEYTLEDGQVITVDEAGVITAITEATEEVEEVEESMSEEPVDNLAPLNEKIDNLTNALAGVLEKFAEVDAQLTEANERIEKFAAAPASDEPVIEPAEPKRKGKEDALKALAQFRKNG
jgi:hypothetical protein